MREKDARTCAIISIDGWLRMGEVVMMTVRRSLSDMFKAAISTRRARCSSRLFEKHVHSGCGASRVTLGQDAQNQKQRRLADRGRRGCKERDSALQWPLLA